MNDTQISDAPRRYPVEIRQVREVMLTGRADLDFWRRRLQPEALVPRSVAGHAAITLTAISARWFGLVFRECTISVAISSDVSGQDPVGFFLIQAFNNLPAFAWVERVLFRTPYIHGGIGLATEPPCRLDLVLDDRPVLQARMGAARALSPATRAMDWQGSIFLPGRTASDPGSYFDARLTGPAGSVAFDPATDVLNLSETSGLEAIDALRSSGFVAETWHVRAAAVHGRTASLRRAG